ncbi:30S ribosomal protein S10 [Candidatus Vidania fulgoroideorum]
MIKIIFFSNNLSVINNSMFRFLNKIKKYNIFFKGPISVPNKKKFFDIIKSPHVDKNSRDQYEIIKYKRFFLLKINKFFFKKIMKIRFSSELGIYMKKE